MENVVAYVCAKFGDDRLWNEKALADRNSDNNNNLNPNNKNNVGGARRPVSGYKNNVGISVRQRLSNDSGRRRRRTCIDGLARTACLHVHAVWSSLSVCRPTSITSMSRRSIIARKDIHTWSESTDQFLCCIIATKQRKSAQHTILLYSSHNNNANLN